MRKLILILFFALVAFPYLTVNAEDVNFEADIDETIGIIIGLDGDFLYISGDALTIEGYDEAILQLGDAPIYDLITGLSVSVSCIIPGMEARVAYYDTKDFPQALTIWLHPNHENAAVFTATVSDNIQYGLGYTVFLSADGRYRITITDDTFIYGPLCGTLNPEDIEPGQDLFVWVDMITASSPALVYPEKIVLIH